MMHWIDTGASWTYGTSTGLVWATVDRAMIVPWWTAYVVRILTREPQDFDSAADAKVHVEREWTAWQAQQRHTRVDVPLPPE